MEEEFDNFRRRLAGLDDEIRMMALEYASEIYQSNKCSKEEALEKAITRAEMEKRDLEP